MARKGNEIEVAVAEVVDYLRITGDFAPALRSVVERKVTLEAARKNGIKVTAKELQSAADTFRSLYDLGKATDTERWLESSGISLETFEEYLEANILISKFKYQLENKASKAEYLSSPEIKESVRQMIYQDWLNKQLE